MELSANAGPEEYPSGTTTGTYLVLFKEGPPRPAPRSSRER